MTSRPPASAAATANVGLITWNDMSAATATGGRLARTVSCWATRVSVALAEMARPTQIVQAASNGMKTSSAGSWGACSTAVATSQIARAFLVHETAIAQRITRAKRKITDAGIPYRVPDDDELAARLTEVLTVIYLLFNEGYLATTGPPASRDLAEDAEWLASLLHQLMPTEPEVAGLIALIRLHRARAAARFAADGGLVLLRDQDRSLWDREAIADAVRLLTRAARRQRPGPYQLQAAIVACHAEAERFGDTDWEQIVLLYDMLLHLAPSPVTRLHRAIAVRYATGAQAAMAELEDLADVLGEYHLYHASRAELLRELGQPDQARAADRRALDLTANPAEQAVLQQRLSWI